MSLTARELENIKRRAEAVGMRVGNFGRALLLAMPDDAALKPAPESRINRLVHAQLVRLGNNLNQMVRHLHATGDPLPADLEPLLRDIRQLIDRRCCDDR
ncbi:MAG: plasmid mobilization relaxosome protein MobC [Roseiarcus sp.]